MSNDRAHHPDPGDLLSSAQRRSRMGLPDRPGHWNPDPVGPGSLPQVSHILGPWINQMLTQRKMAALISDERCRVLIDEIYFEL